MTTWRDFGSLSNGHCSFGRAVDGAACHKEAGHAGPHVTDYPLPKPTRGQLAKALETERFNHAGTKEHLRLAREEIEELNRRMYALQAKLPPGAI